MESEDIICFVCRNKTTSILNDESNWGTRRTTASRLENNLDVIFILRNLLQVPSSELESQLMRCGDHPEDWISLCDQCTQLTDKAKYLHQEIKEIRKHLWEKIILSSTDDDTDEGNGSSIEFQKKIRLFVKQNNNKDGFLEDDKLANYLASKQKSSAAQIVTVENPVDDVEEGLEMEVESPSSPPPSCPSSSPPAAEKGDPVTGNSSEKPDEETECSIKTTVKRKQRRRRRIEVKVKEKRKRIRKRTKKTDEPAVRCNLCEKEFKAKHILKDHIRFVHEKKFSWKCQVCGLGLRSQTRLNTHLLAVHSEDPVSKRLEIEKGFKLSSCKVPGCFAQYLKKEYLDNHMQRLHGGDKGWSVRFKCKLCGKGYWARNKLRDHETTHDIATAERNWKCAVCGNRFGTERNLRLHELNIHKIYKKDKIAQK